MSKRTPPKTTSGGDNPYNIHDAKLSRSATTHESSFVTAHEISNNVLLKIAVWTAKFIVMLSKTAMVRS